ncbi:MAG: cyclase family protein [Clostridiales bacterium]|jgi:arylformamidase|nr:cyclase family protein [Clostridiales bacterium]
MNIIDISRDILSSPVYPGDPLPEVEFLQSIADGDECNLSALSMGLHTATHVDAPLHFIEGGKSIDMLDLSAYVGPCKVIEVPSGLITAEYVENNFPRDCERLLIKGQEQAAFMDSAAEETAALGVRLIGTDARSIGSQGNQIKPHKAFLGRDVAVLEGLDLSRVEPGNYFLIAPPVKAAGLEAAPARALLISDFVFWSAKN